MAISLRCLWPCISKPACYRPKAFYRKNTVVVATQDLQEETRIKTISSLSKVEEERAEQLYEKAIVINTMDSTALPQFDSKYCEKLADAGITALNTTVNVNVAFRPHEGLPEVMRQFYIWYDKLRENSDKIVQINSAEDIRKAKKDGKTGIIFGFQNPKPIDGDPDLIKIFHRLGLKICGLVYTRRNAFADGCGEKTDVGLSRIGEMFVAEMNKLHILIEMSHCQTRASLETIALSKDPVAFTHSNSKGVYDMPRNLTDEQIKACAEKGGVIGVNAFSNQLHPKAEMEGATIEHCLDHIEYDVRLVGANHVGIGTDSAEGRTIEDAMALSVAYPELRTSTMKLDQAMLAKRYALKDILDFKNYSRGLVARGYSDQEILKILGGNWLSLFEKIWRGPSY